MITDTQSPSPARPAHRRRVTRTLTAAAAVAVMGLIAAACGSSTPNSSATTLAQSPAGSPSATTQAAAAGTTVVKAASNTTIGGSILVNPAGMTLYTLSADTGGMSSCSSACASIWPPVTVAAGMTPAGTGTSGTLATTTRSDGSLQVTYNGQPLYTFVGDKSAGAASGNGIKSFGGTWSVVKVGSSSSSGTGAVAPDTTTTKASSGGGYSY